MNFLLTYRPSGAIIYNGMQTGLKVPFGDIRKQTVKLTFFSDVKLGGAIEGVDAVNDAVIKGIFDAVNYAVNDAVNKGIIDAVNDAVIVGLIDVVKVINKNINGVGINELIKVSEKSHRTVQRYLQTLKIINLIEFQGAAKTGKYFLTKKFKSKIK